ncbi:MAG: SRPBCC family protein [Pseudomonadota bacterium]
MKLSARSDIEAPIEQVFDRLTDFEAHERQALKRGVNIARLDAVHGLGTGMSWETRFAFRGRERRVIVNLQKYDPYQTLEFSLAAALLAGVFETELITLAERRTRLILRLELRPANLRGRLLIQTLKLRKSDLQGRLEERLSDFSDALEAEHALAPPPF